MKEWTVGHQREIIFFALMFLISSLSFGLGYLMNREFNHAPIVIEQPAPASQATH